jgi:hypothetical protein
MAGFGTPNFIGVTIIKTYLCPKDPTHTFIPLENPYPSTNAGQLLWAPTNYVYNGILFSGYDGPSGSAQYARLVNITDGASNTAMFTERDAMCDGSQLVGTFFARGCFWDWTQSQLLSGNSQRPLYNVNFTNIVTGQSCTPDGSGVQVPTQAPAPGYCNPCGFPQSGHIGAIQVGMCDGSVRSPAALRDAGRCRGVSRPPSRRPRVRPGP